MKKIIISMIMLFAGSFVQGQITERDSLNNIETSIYVGTLGGPKVGIDAKVSGFVGTRIGGTITWTPSKYVSFLGLGAGEYDQTGAVTPFALFATNIMYKKVKLVLGKMASPMTELRPLPTTASGQFEPWTKAQILGSSLGAKASLNYNGMSFVGGTFLRGNEYSHEIGFKIKNFHAACYLMNVSGEFGGAVNANLKNISTTFMFNDNKNIGMLNIINLPYSHDFFAYSDIGFSTKSDKMIRGEWGVFKNFSTHHIKGLLGLGYSDEVSSFKAYIFLHI